LDFPINLGEAEQLRKKAEKLNVDPERDA